MESDGTKVLSEQTVFEYLIGWQDNVGFFFFFFFLLFRFVFISSLEIAVFLVEFPPPFSTLLLSSSTSQIWKKKKKKGRKKEDWQVISKELNISWHVIYLGWNARRRSDFWKLCRDHISDTCQAAECIVRMSEFMYRYRTKKEIASDNLEREKIVYTQFIYLLV